MSRIYHFVIFLLATVMLWMFRDYADSLLVYVPALDKCQENQDIDPVGELPMQPALATVGLCAG